MIYDISFIYIIHKRLQSSLKRPSHDKLKLANSKELANSCFHTTNTRQITTHANLQNRRRTPLVPCFYFMFNRRKHWKNINLWTEPYLSRNPSFVAYTTLVQELRIEDAAGFKSYLRYFHFLLLIFCIFIRRGRLHVARPPFVKCPQIT